MDFLIYSNAPFDCSYYFQKLNHAVLRYEIVLWVKTAWIIFIYDLFSAGCWNDIFMFRSNLKNCCDKNERGC